MDRACAFERLGLLQLARVSPSPSKVLSQARILLPDRWLQGHELSKAFLFEPC